jgi:hypothetical protein
MMTCYVDLSWGSWEIWALIAYDVIAVAGSVLLFMVMQKCEHDPACMRDGKWIKDLRRWGFVQSTLILLGSSLQPWYGISLVLVLLELGYGVIYHVGVNYLALHYRQATPNSDVKLMGVIPQNAVRGAGAMSRSKHRE